MDIFMVCNTWAKTSLFALSFDTIQLHIEQKTFQQYSFIFGHMAMKHPVLSMNSTAYDSKVSTVVIHIS